MFSLQLNELTNYMSKTIRIMRHFNLVEMQQSDPEVKAWLGESFRGIGPYFKNKATATGLSFEEEKLLLPELLHIEATDKQFRAAVNRYFDEIVTIVPKGGLELQIGLKDPSKPLSETNMPINITDYIRYRHLLEHRDVAMTEADAQKTFGKRFYLLDPERESKGALNLNSLEDKAMVIYMKYKDDNIKMDQILTMMSVNITNLKHAEKVLKLKAIAQKNPALNEHDQAEAFNKFISTAEDKDLEYKYLIEEMIGAQYLSRVGNHILYAESGKKIGDNVEDTVLYFKNPKNSRELNLLKSQYSLKVKKGDAYLPGSNPEPVTVEEPLEYIPTDTKNKTKQKTE